ncbi:hypothetical protein BT93_I0655 [Corymbia citriodora subsp. variegata]|nr:hypothetical protein BT93_I0655 [Corymbia citriodora subsp. variegata]
MNYSFWMAQFNSLLLGYDLMGYAWNKVSHLFANKTHLCIINLKERLILTKRDNGLVAKYLQIVKEVANELVITNSPISDHDLIIHASKSPISFEEHHDKLVNFEQSLKKGRVIVN